METYYVKLGQKLRELRKAKKYTLVQVAERLGVTHKTLANYETGNHKPSHTTLLKLCMIYNYDIGQLMDESITYLESDFYDR